MPGFSINLNKHVFSSTEARKMFVLHKTHNLGAHGDCEEWRCLQWWYSWYMRMCKNLHFIQHVLWTKASRMRPDSKWRIIQGILFRDAGSSSTLLELQASHGLITRQYPISVLLQTWTSPASICIQDPSPTVKIYHGSSHHLGNLLLVQNLRPPTRLCDRINWGSFCVHGHVDEVNKSAISSFENLHFRRHVSRTRASRMRPASTSRQKAEKSQGTERFCEFSNDLFNLLTF